MNEDAPTGAMDQAARDAPVSLVGLLDELAEPVAPPPVPLTPQTAGWAVLAAMLAVALLALIAWRVRRWRANAYRRAALAELATAGEDPAAIALVLRRTALAAWPRAEVAGLSGEAWLAFLDRSGGQPGFVEGPGRALLDAPYRSGPPQPGLAPLAARWVRRHRAPRPTRRRGAPSDAGRALREAAR